VTDRPSPFGSRQEPPTFRADLIVSRRRRFGPAARATVVALVVAVLTSVLVVAWVKLAYLSDLPPIPSDSAIWSLNRAPGVTFLDRNGVKIASRGPRHGRRVRLAELPAYAPRAFLAAEDRRFYRHGAVDWVGAGRALLADVRAGAAVQGGSTLSQQLAKTVFLTSDKTIKRKVQEAALAIELERRLGKDQILELYLNRVFFGASAYGVEAAAQAYFNKPAAVLTLPEAALLAALPKAPSRLSPANDMGAAVERSRVILRRMAEEGWISPAELQRALANPPTLSPEPGEEADFGYVLDLAQTETASLAKGRAPDLIVQLSIDRTAQVTAAQIARRVIQTQGRGAKAREAALVALSPDGGIRAMVGGLDHGFSRFNRAVQAQRQPGSAFKPFVYAAALERGISPTDIRKDAPPRMGPWSPANYDGTYRGPVTVEEALVKSINTVAVRLAQEAGVDRIGDIDQRFGLTSIPPRPGLSVALGAYEINLLELTSGYQVFQQDGRRVDPYLIVQISSSSGELIYLHQPSPVRQVYDPGRAGQMVRMLKGVIQRGTGTHAAFGRPAAGKTGTSQSWRDAWFVGFTPDWVCGVWVGNDDGAQMNKVTGGDLPAEIWRRFMLAAHDGLPARDFPFLGGAATGQAEAASPPGEERSAFYRELQGEFAAAAQSGEGPD
jgi:penicillin-binding protein 1A